MSSPSNLCITKSMYLIANLPNQRVWVRKEFLRDQQDGHGELVEGYWVSIKSIPGRCFLWETYLPSYGALYDKLPISAFVSKPQLPTPSFDLANLQYWNAMDLGVRVLPKSFIEGMRVECLTKDHGSQWGNYILTIDNFHINAEAVDTGVSQDPQEHKSHNLVALDNGQFAVYPNNRMRVYDPSLSPSQLLKPDLKVCTRVFEVDNQPQQTRLGDQDSFDYSSF